MEEEVWTADYLPALCWSIILEFTTASETLLMRLLTRSGRERTAKALGGRIATACSDGRAYVWNAATGALLMTFDTNGHWVRKVVLKGREVSTTSVDGTARTWDSTTGELLNEETAEDSPRTKRAFSPDGRYLVTASTDAKTARIWDARTGHEKFLLSGHQNIVESCTFSPDSKRILTTSFDSTARLWDAATGQPLGVLRHRNRFNGRPDLFVLACDFKP